MTPKEKARELFDNFGNYVDDCSYTSNFSEENAKMCALISVNEIIKVLRKDLPEIGLGKGYWYNVRKEIEKL